MKKLNIIFFGSPAFAVPSLEALYHAGHHILAVVTAPDQPKARARVGRGSCIKEKALALHLPVLQPSNLTDPQFIQTLQGYQPDLQIVIGFKFLDQAIWSISKLGTINLHASLLPQYRGAAPIHWAIIHGEQETGVTTFFLQEKIDTGAIIFQEKEPIDPKDTYGTLAHRLKIKGAHLVLKTVQAIANQTYTAYPQPAIPVHMLKKAPKIYPQTCMINFNQSAQSIHNFIRGFAPQPGAWTMLFNERYKILEAIPSTEPLGLAPGEYVIHTKQKHLYIGTQDDALAITQLQPPGKRIMNTAAFLQGKRFE